ncbi:MAG: D-glutamate cyclase family protein, partial [Planctomycetaceae bacterium]
AIRAVQVTSRYPAVHGAPVHLGHPAAIGITALDRPDFGDAVPVAPEEIPVFWACGVTPQSVVMAVRPPFAITHSPGCMLVTDLMDEELAVG